MRGGLWLIILLICSNRKICTISSVRSNCSKCSFKHTMQLILHTKLSADSQADWDQLYQDQRNPKVYPSKHVRVYPAYKCKQLFLICQYVMNIKSLTRDILNCNYKNLKKTYICIPLKYTQPIQKSTSNYSIVTLQLKYTSKRDGGFSKIGLDGQLKGLITFRTRSNAK